MTRTPRPTPRGTSRARSACTGARICSPNWSATSSVPRSSPRCWTASGSLRRRRVILYGGNKNWFAAYAYWYFKYYGHERVQLLNGGRKKWELEGRPLVTDVPATFATRGYPVPHGNDKIRAYRDQVASEIVGKAGKGLVDVRSPEEYRGESLAPAHLPQEGAQRGGHIPGARNIPWGKAVDPDQETFLSAEQLSQLYQGEGITPDQEIVAYCRIGERSAHTWFVLHELLGYPNVRNYDGSWTEWGSLVKAPIEK